MELVMMNTTILMVRLAATAKDWHAEIPDWAPSWLWWAFYPVLSQQLWRFAALFATLIISLAAGRTVRFILEQFRRRSHEPDKLGPLLLQTIAKPVSFGVIAIGIYLAGLWLQLSEKLRDLWYNVGRALMALAVAYLLYKLVDILEHYLRRWTSRTQTKLDDQLVPIIRKSLRIFIIIVVGLFIAQNVFNANISALLGGLAIGGLAFSLAAKDTISNVFGSITIFADRPFKLGDRIHVGEHDGLVEEVGFRSTKIRTLTGHLVTIPNQIIANTQVENIGARPYIRRVADIAVTYDTSPEKLREAIEIIKEILNAEPTLTSDPNHPPRVYFGEFADFSLNIRFYYWHRPADWWQYMQTTDRVNHRILERFNEAGIEFAFPTQTLYLKKDISP